MSTQKLVWYMHAIGLTILSPFQQTVMALCGHATKYRIVDFDGGTIATMPLDESGLVTHCYACIKMMAIRCAWCGKEIRISDPVTLYQAKDTFVPPEYAVAYDASQRIFVGCLHMDCGDPFDRQGFWEIPGKVRRVPSPLEMVLGSGEAVFVENIADPYNIGTVVEL